MSDDCHHIWRDDADYPELLKQIPNPPGHLYVKGDPACLSLPGLAIVGSRNPTPGGRRNSFEFARYLGSSGFAIVSGLARGIDTAAHRGALDAGTTTIAVLAHGLDSIYPPQNRSLAAQIVAQGALVSEYAPGTPPRKEHFPQRNRLISGLTVGTIVVEAAKRSGSLITARHAGEQGREVFALPGSIHNPLARGCHRLIRQGAKLVESADDIVSEIGALTGHMAQPSVAHDISSNDGARVSDPDYRDLLACLGHDPIGTDALVTESGLTIDRVSSMLLILELDGIVEKQAGGRYILKA